MWQITALALLALCLASTPASLVAATTVRTATPLMGWNSYNYYGCSPSETIIKTNAAGLVSLGLHDAGYDLVTPDCGWSATYRDATTGQLVWSPELFPSGGDNLSDYVHGLGLKFGMYSGAGHYQCGSTDQPASLGESPNWNFSLGTRTGEVVDDKDRIRDDRRRLVCCVGSRRIEVSKNFSRVHSLESR